MAALSDRLTQLEDERIHCLVGQDYAGPAKLLSPELLHTHARGNLDDRSSYSSFVANVVRALEIRRENLRIMELGQPNALSTLEPKAQSHLRGRAESSSPTRTFPPMSAAHVMITLLA